MLLNVLNWMPARPNFTTINANSVLAEGRPATAAEFVIDPVANTFTKPGVPSTSPRSFGLTRTELVGKLMFRMRFNAREYNWISVWGATRLWYSHRMDPNVWHTVRMEFGSINKYYLNDVLMYSGSDKGFPDFYIHSDVLRVDFDTGQLGTTLPAGYAWY